MTFQQNNYRHDTWARTW